MGKSIIMPVKRGVGSECTGNEPVFTVSLKAQDGDQFSTYHIVGTDLSYGETDSTIVTQTIGGDVFMYCTGAQPVTITMTGVIIYSTCKEDDKKFRKFWNKYRIGTYKKLLELTLDGDVYYVALMSYLRQPTSSEADLDVIKMTFVGVAAKNNG